LENAACITAALTSCDADEVVGATAPRVHAATPLKQGAPHTLLRAAPDAARGQLATAVHWSLPAAPLTSVPAALHETANAWVPEVTSYAHMFERERRLGTMSPPRGSTGKQRVSFQSDQSAPTRAGTGRLASAPAMDSHASVDQQELRARHGREAAMVVGALTRALAPSQAPAAQRRVRDPQSYASPGTQPHRNYVGPSAVAAGGRVVTADVAGAQAASVALPAPSPPRYALPPHSPHSPQRRDVAARGRVPTEVLAERAPSVRRMPRVEDSASQHRETPLRRGVPAVASAAAGTPLAGRHVFVVGGFAVPQ
jgi:hypothetical protein